MDMKAKATVALVVIAACAGWAQSPQIIQTTRQKLQGAQQTWNAHNQVLNAGKPTATASAVKAVRPEPKTAKSGKTAKPDSAASLGLRPAKSLLPKNEVNTQMGEEHFTAAARRDSGKRDPFLSPVVTKITGPSNCSGGKKCLPVDQIALKGIVRSDNGMIAVVTNSANKAYFLREKDPVFNGYVVKITGDSVLFKETVEDNLGHRSTRDVVKKIFTPAV
jgi:Tfp pilus assembly protein PilP